MTYDAYVICGTPRTGSTLLIGLLAATKTLGDPDSYFTRQTVYDWAKDWGISRSLPTREFNAAYLAAAIKAGRGGTPIFGLRLMRENLEELMTLVEDVHGKLPSDKARFETAFGRTLFIHLFRANKLAQAVSLVKAGQTGLWHAAPDGTEIERLAPPAEPAYDVQAIRRELEQIEGFDAAWNSWFEVESIQPLRIGYEALSADPSAAFATICSTLGVPAPDQVQPGVARLSDATNDEWIRRYRAEAGG